MELEAKSIKKTYIFCPNPAFDVKAKIQGFEQGKPTRILNEEVFPGGKGVHVAMVLAELGMNVELLGIWGKGNKEAFVESCHYFYPELNITGSEISGFIRTCYTFIADNDWKDTELLGAGPTVSENEILALEDWIDNNAREINLFAICGSWPKGAPEDATARVLRKCNEYKIRTAVDASGIQLINALNEKPYLLHLNKNELEQLIHANVISDADKLMNDVKLVAVTYGKEGLHLLNDDEKLAVNVKLDETVISTVGSGDALTAGIIYGISNGATTAEAGKWGVACGAANCVRKELGLVHREKVLELFTKSKVALLNEKEYES